MSADVSFASDSRAAAPDAPRYSLLIPSFRSLRFLPECLGSLRGLEGPSYEVLFLENGSPEPEAAWIEANISDPKFRVFRVKETLYFTGGINYLADRARGTFIVLFNSDASVKPDWLKNLDDYLTATGYEAAGCLVQDASRGESTQGRRFALDPLGLSHYVPQGVAASGPPLIAAGCGLTVRRDVFFELGRLDDDFKMYFEDIDFCWKMGLRRYRIGYAPEAVMYHVGQGSVSKKSFFLWNRFRGRRNRVWGYLQNAGPLMLAIFLPSYLAVAIASIALNLARLRVRNAVAEVAALAAAAYHAPRALSKRGAVQRARLASDSELVNRGFVYVRVKYLGGLLRLLFHDRNP